MPAACSVSGGGGAASASFAGALLAGGYTLQTLGLERTSVSSAGFITGMYVVLTPLIAFACFRVRIGAAVWGGVVLATGGLALLAGVHGGAQGGNALVLAGAAVYSLQIVLMERYAPRYDVLGFTLVEMLAAFALLGVVAVPDDGGAARVDGLGSASRHGGLRERARLPRADVGSAVDECDADGRRLHPRAGLGRDLRVLARR